MVDEMTIGEMQLKWHNLKHEIEQERDGERVSFLNIAFRAHERELAGRLWDAAVQLREEDRRKHPKAKRNLPPPIHETAPDRYLP